MRITTLRQIVLISMFALLWIASACGLGGKSGERANGQRGGEITYRVSAPPTTFNYLIPSDENSLIVAFYLMGGRLVEFDHKDQRYVFGLAEELKRLDDGKTVDLTLRDGIKFSDGHPITAEDVIFTLRAIYDERTASPIFSGAMLIGNRQIEASIPDGTDNKNARRVRLVFPDIVASPENYLSNLAVLPRHILEADLNRGALREAYSLTADPSRIVTSGAFAPESATPGERITLKRNPHYWKKDDAGVQLPYLDRLVIEVIKDANNALSRLQQGSLDMYDRIRPPDFAELKSQSGITSATDLGPGLQTDHLWFNLNQGESNGKPIVNPMKRGWFSDIRFRQAIAHAIDRDSIAKNTLQGLATPLYGYVSPGNRVWGATDIPAIAYDLEKSRALLREAGFTTRGPQDRPELFDANGNRVELTMIVPSVSQPRKDMAIVIQEDLSRLGIKAQAAPIDGGEFIRRITESYDYDAAIGGTAPSEPDPSTYTNFLLSNSNSNQWYPKQPRPATPWGARIDELLSTQSREINPDRRRAIFHEIQQILSKELPVIPIVARHASVAVNKRVGNYNPSSIVPFSLWNAERLFVR